MLVWLPNKLGEEQYCIIWVLFLYLPRIEDWMSEATQQEQRTLPWCLQSPWCHARVTCHEDVTKRSRKGHVTISSNLSPVTENRMSRLKFSIQQKYHREGLTVTVLASDWSHTHSSRISLAVSQWRVSDIDGRTLEAVSLRSEMQTVVRAQWTSLLSHKYYCCQVLSIDR